MRTDDIHVNPPAPSAAGRKSFSIAGKLAGVVFLGIVILAAAIVALDALGVATWISALAGLALVLPAVAWGAGRSLAPLHRTLAALSDGIRSFRDHDFSMRISVTRNDELGDLVRLYNEVCGTLQAERGQIRQRELLLQTALDQSPIAIILVNPLDRIVYANHEARRLFLGGGAIQGMKFADLMEGCPKEMRQVMGSARDGIFTVEGESQPETYHLAERGFYLNRQRHRLYLLRRMTAELARQEAEIWKKVIRIISHELNNSLAPISSLAHSGLLIAKTHHSADQIAPIYESIRERVDHLTRFLEGYARFARLPEPRPQSVDWSEWLEAPRRLYSFEMTGDIPSEPGHFDPSQLQQAFINLLKNATEASEHEPEITVGIDRLPDGAFRVQVMDRGRGMNEEVMRQALLPFYSTKIAGGGVGLPLCREIVEAHGGSIRIQSREGGGTIVSFWLPPMVV